MTHPLGSIRNHASDTLKAGLMLPARVAARGFGVAKGTASVGVGVVRAARQAPPSPWAQAIADQ